MMLMEIDNLGTALIIISYLFIHEDQFPITDH